MNNFGFILNYVESCVSGRLSVSDCGSVWHLSIILGLVLVMLIALVVLRLRDRGQESAA